MNFHNIRIKSQITKPSSWKFLRQNICNSVNVAWQRWQKRGLLFWKQITGNKSRIIAKSTLVSLNLKSISDWVFFLDALDFVGPITHSRKVRKPPHESTGYKKHVPACCRCLAHLFGVAGRFVWVSHWTAKGFLWLTLAATCPHWGTVWADSRYPAGLPAGPQPPVGGETTPQGAAGGGSVRPPDTQRRQWRI